MPTRPIITEGMSEETIDWLMAQERVPAETIIGIEALMAPPRTYENIEAYMDVETPGSVLQPQRPPARGEILKAGFDPSLLLGGLGAAATKLLPLIGVGAGTAAVIGGGLAAVGALTRGNGAGGGAAGGGYYGALQGSDFTFKGVLFQGPGVKEPHPAQIIKDWYIQVNNHKLHFFSLLGGRMACVDEETGKVSVWRPKKNIVLSSNPRIPQLLKAAKKIDNTFLALNRRMGKYRKRTTTRRK